MIAILMYHRVCEPKLSDPRPGLCVSPEVFDAQLREIAARGYRFVTFAELAERTPKGKLAVLTFDDGTEDNYHEAFPILKRHGASATVFVVTGLLGRPNAYAGSAVDGGHTILTSSQVAEMAAAGIEFGSHTCTHRSLPSLSDEELERELSESRRSLAAIVQREVLAIAYPYGHRDARVLAATGRAGYRFGCTTNRGRNSDLSASLLLKRIPMRNGIRGARLRYRLSRWYDLEHRLRRRRHRTTKTARSAPEDRDRR